MFSTAHSFPFHASTGAPRRSRWRRGVLIALTGVVLLLLAARLALPAVLRHAVNRRLESIPEYTGHVDRIGVSLWRGAYTMHGLRIDKREADTTRAFAAAEQVDFSLAWQKLFEGEIVSEIVATRPRLDFVQASTAAASQLDFDRRWQDVIQDLFPIEITHFEAVDGELHFVAPGREPPVDIFLRDLQVRVRGLRNRPDLDREALPATVLVEGSTPGNGRLSLSGELEPLAVQPRFHLRLKLDQLSLPAINQFLLAYGKVDVSRGEFTGYLEMVARDGRYQGYFKPFFEDLVFKGGSGGDRSLFARLWERIVAGVTALVKNDDTQQVALRIPFSGEFGDTSFRRWESIRTLFRNGFIKALAEGMDGHPRPVGDTEKAPPPAVAKEPGKSE